MKDGRKKQSEAVLHSPRGMHDVMPEDALLFEKFRLHVKGIAEFYGFNLIDTPVVEHAALYERSVGVTTDIVEKEMYSFRTKGGDRFALRPEGTAGVSRAYIQHGMATWPQPVKLWYWGPMFRHDAPQALRYRQFHHAGFECFGEAHPVMDVELIQLTYRILEEFGISSMRIEISSIGCKSCRLPYRNALKAFYRPKARRLCADCRKRLINNPLRLLDCKNETCILLRSGAPEMIERLCEPCRSHFKQVLRMLDDLGYPYLLNPYLVRGLDYYNRTVFEIFPEPLGLKKSSVKVKKFSSENTNNVLSFSATDQASNQPPKTVAIASGGRFDYLTEFIGGPMTPAVGLAIGVERAVHFLKKSGAKIPTTKSPKIFLVQLGDLARVKALKLLEEFRKEGVGLAASLGRDSIKAQLKSADRMGAMFALIIGHKEVVDGNVILRDMRSGTQESIPVSQIIKTLRERWKRAKG